VKIFLTVFAFLTSSLNFLIKQAEPTISIPTLPPVPSVSSIPIPSFPPLPSVPSKPFILPPIPTPQPLVSPSPEPTTNINDYVYPGSQIISSSTNNLSLKSTDDPQTVISWYEAKINGGFSDRSDNVTNTNGSVNATLSATGGSQKINITIQKTAGELYTNMEIAITSQ